MADKIEISKSIQPIKPAKPTNGPSFGLLPTSSPEFIGDKTFSLLFAEGLIADPKTANEKLFTAEFFGVTGPIGRTGRIKPKFGGWYRIDFYCGFNIRRLELSSKPNITITTILKTESTELANIENSFKHPMLHYFHMSRVVHLAAKTPVSVSFKVRQEESEVKLWLGSSTSDSARALTGFYLTLLERESATETTKRAS